MFYRHTIKGGLNYWSPFIDCHLPFRIAAYPVWYCICFKLSMALFFVASICVQLALTATFYRIIQKPESKNYWYYLNCLIHVIVAVNYYWPGVLTKYCLMFSCFTIMYNGFFADSYIASDVKNKSKDRVHAQNVACIWMLANAGTRTFPQAIPMSSIRKLLS